MVTVPAAEPSRRRRSPRIFRVSCSTARLRSSSKVTSFLSTSPTARRTLASPSPVPRVRHLHSRRAGGARDGSETARQREDGYPRETADDSGRGRARGGEEGKEEGKEGRRADRHAPLSRE